jgi:hypothetical protein
MPARGERLGVTCRGRKDGGDHRPDPGHARQALVRRAVAGRRDQAPVELGRPFLEPTEVLDQSLQQLAGERRQAPVLGVADHGQQLAQAGLPLGGDDAELGQVCPQAVDRRRALLQQLLAHPVQHQQWLLALLLHRHEPHAGPLHRLAAGLRVGRIVLTNLP